MIYDGGDSYSNFIGASKSGDKSFMIDVISDELSNVISDSKSRNEAVSFLVKNGFSVKENPYNEDLASTWIKAMPSNDIMLVYTSKTIHDYHNDDESSSKEKNTKIDSKSKSKITDVSTSMSDFFKSGYSNDDEEELIRLTTIKSNNKSPQFAKHDADSLTKEERKIKEAKKEKRDIYLMALSTALILGYYFYKVKRYS